MMLPVETAADVLLGGVLMIVFDISAAFYHKAAPKYHFQQSATRLNHDSE